MTTKRFILLWLGSICGLIILMVVIGGITRLTHSGLSIVEWRPITGVIPPLTDAAWQEMFEKYQRFPEYQLLNHGMALSEFKWIFFWEYLHRLIGRLIGAVVFLPWIFFLIRRSLPRRLAYQTGFGFFLGGLQGLMGWIMVKSGLVQNPQVSHYRLAAHLILAFLVLAYFFWLFLSAARSEERIAETSQGAASVRRWSGFLIALILVQVTYGAFTAGLKAGFGFNTFPKMNDQWVPSGLLMQPGVRNFFENPIAVQFLHRSVAWALVMAVILFWFRMRGIELSSRLRYGTNALLLMILVQFGLGVATLVWVVPVSVATLHQLGACILFLVAIFLRHSAARSEPIA